MADNIKNITPNTLFGVFYCFLSTTTETTAIIIPIIISPIPMNSLILGRFFRYIQEKKAVATISRINTAMLIETAHIDTPMNIGIEANRLKAAGMQKYNGLSGFLLDDLV